MSRIAVYAGSFDPLHRGHVDVIRRGVALFDRVIVAVARNVSKRPLFDLDERIALVTAELEDEPRISVETFDGLVVRFAQQRGACALLRGVRNMTDLDYEANLARMNRALAPDLDTAFLLTDPALGHLSSSLIKEVASLGGDLAHALPERTLRAVLERLAPPLRSTP